MLHTIAPGQRQGTGHLISKLVIRERGGSRHTIFLAPFLGKRAMALGADAWIWHPCIDRSPSPSADR
eukprot:469242-Heterocapsa_arctica.AAC.1